MQFLSDAQKDLLVATKILHIIPLNNLAPAANLCNMSHQPGPNIISYYLHNIIDVYDINIQRLKQTTASKEFTI